MASDGNNKRKSMHADKGNTEVRVDNVDLGTVEWHDGEYRNINELDGQ